MNPCRLNVLPPSAAHAMCVPELMNVCFSDRVCVCDLTMSMCAVVRHLHLCITDETADDLSATGCQP